MTHPYYQAAVYPTKNAAGKAYTSLERIIYEADCDLSAYRLLLPRKRKYLVVVIGEAPGHGLHERLRTILTTLTRGEPTTLDENTLILLLARRVQQAQRGSWVEGHYSAPPDDETEKQTDDKG